MNPSHWLHLARRFVESCRPGAPQASDIFWVQRQLSDTEFTLWSRLSNPDQRHSIGVARAVGAAIDDPERWVIGAALLHDVGKVVCGYRTPARVVATLVWAVVPSERALVWQHKGRPRRSLAHYHLHPSLGGELCSAAGSHPLTCAWAAEHHLDSEVWSVPQTIGDVLKACDDD